MFALFWTGSFVGLNIQTEKAEQQQEKKQQLIKQKLLEKLERIKKQDKDAYLSICNSINNKKNIKNHPKNSMPKKILAKSKTTWQQTKNIFIRVREFFNASKDITKSILATCLLFGLVLPVVFAKGSMLVFLGFSTVVFGFSFAVLVEYHVRKKREQKIAKLKQDNKILETHLRHFKQYGEVKQYSPNKHKNPRKKLYCPTANEETTNILKYVTTMLFGAMNGVYFAFTMTSLYWGIIMMPLSASFAIYIPIALLIVSGIGHTLRHSNREYNQQKDEYKTKARYYYYKRLRQERVTVFKEKYPNKKLPSEEKGKNINITKAKKPKTFIEKLSTFNFFSSRAGIEAGRAMKNSTKLVLGFITFFAIPIGGSTPGFIGTFGLLPTMGLIAFATTFAVLSIGIFLWQNERSVLTHQLQQKTNYLKEDITYINKCLTSQSLEETKEESIVELSTTKIANAIHAQKSYLVAPEQMKKEKIDPIFSPKPAPFSPGATEEPNRVDPNTYPQSPPIAATM